MKMTTIGIDLAKDAFQVQGIGEQGEVRVKQQLKRREIRRPTMRFVPIKTVDQQSILAVHRVRQGMVKARTAQGNQIRGLLAEFGLVVPLGISHLFLKVPTILDLAQDTIPGVFRELIHRLLAHTKELTRQIDELEIQIHQWHRTSEVTRNLEKIPGIGPITASAPVASIGDARNFKNGRQLAAWAGLVPKQHSSGGKTKLQGISKRGDNYLRTLLVHGARAVVKSAERKPERYAWLSKLMGRRRRKPSDFIVPPGHLTQVGHPCSSTVQFLHVVVTAPTKKGTRIFILVPRILVRLAGIEPTTPWFVAKYSIQLSYSRPMHAL